MLKLLPPEVTAVLEEFRVCEFTTMARDGTPITWPLAAHYHAPGNHFLLTTTIGLPLKAFRIRRNPRVSLLFSDSTGSGLDRPPAVLVQGDADAPDQIVTPISGVPGMREYWRDKIFARQPATAVLSSNFLLRKLMDWYYMRLVLRVTPRRVFWWPEGDFSRSPDTVDVSPAAAGGA